MLPDLPQLSVLTPKTEDDFKTNINDLRSQRNQKRGELTLIEQQLADQKQKLQGLKTENVSGSNVIVPQ